MNENSKFFFRIFVFLFIVGFIIYANSFQNQLFWDDDDNIVNNLYIKSWKFFPNYFTENLIAGAGFHSNYWRPLLLFSFSIDYKICGLSPFCYHLTNTLLHISNSFLVFLIIFLLFKNKMVAIFTAVFFLLHPVQTEAVTYVSGRGDSLSIFFLLLAFLSYYLAKNKRQWQFLFLTPALFSLALLSKESAIIFPAIILLYEILWPTEDKTKDNLKEFIWRFLLVLEIAILYFVLRLTFLNFGGTLNLYEGENLFTSNILFRIFTFSKVLLIYFSLIFAPLNLYMERSTEIVTSFFNPAVLVSSLIIFLIIFISFYFYRRGNKVFLFGFSLFFIGLFPFSNILVPVNALLYEHWLYFPIIGIGLILAHVLDYLIFNFLIRLPKKLSLFTRWSLIVFVFIFLIGLSVRSILRNFDWKNPITLYTQTLKYTESARVHNNLAMALDRKGEYQQAITHYQRAIEISDIYPQTHNNLANTYKKIGEIKNAIKEFEIAIAMDKYFYTAYDNLAKLYFEQDELQKSIEVYGRYLRFVPNNLSAWYNLGTIYYLKKDYNEAINCLERILEFQPNNQQVFNLILKIEAEKNAAISQ